MPCDMSRASVASARVTSSAQGSEAASAPSPPSLPLFLPSLSPYLSRLLVLSPAPSARLRLSVAGSSLGKSRWQGAPLHDLVSAASERGVPAASCKHTFDGAGSTFEDAGSALEGLQRLVVVATAAHTPHDAETGEAETRAGQHQAPHAVAAHGATVAACKHPRVRTSRQAGRQTATSSTRQESRQHCAGRAWLGPDCSSS